MKLGSLSTKKNPLDGELCLVSQNLKFAVSVRPFFEARKFSFQPTLRECMENYGHAWPLLEEIQKEFSKIALKSGESVSIDGIQSSLFDATKAQWMSALPRTFLFADGSSFIHHVKLVRMARKAPLPETLSTVPLVYQGECGRFLAPTEAIPQIDVSHGTDFEAEVGVITDFVPMGTKPDQALKHIKLFVLINDVSLRGLIPEELAQGFGFFQSKPASALSPFAITADELGDKYQEGRIHLPLQVRYNNGVFGQADAGAMHFHFGQLIAHVARTRDLAAGSLIGSGTVSNENPAVGSSCLVEKRMIETINDGSPKTPFMKVGDSIEIWMENTDGQDLFGHIKQVVEQK